MSRNQFMRRCVPLVSLIVIAFTIYAPLAWFTPVPFADDGFYMHMLEHFNRTGVVDHVSNCSAAVVGQIFLVSPLTRIANFGIREYDFVGIAFALITLSGVYACCQRRVSSNAAFLLSISLLAFPTFIWTAPSFMTDMPFMALFVWWLYCTDRILSVRMLAGRSDRENIFCFLAWIFLLLFAAMTRITIALALPGFFLAAYACPQQRKKLLLLGIASVCTVAIALIIAKQVTINSLDLLQTTGFLDVFVHHQMSSLHIRKMCVAVAEVLLTLSPILICAKQQQQQQRQQQRFRLTPVQITVTLIGFALASLVVARQTFQPIYWGFNFLVVGLIAWGSFNIPPIILGAYKRNKLISILLVSFIAIQLAVEPFVMYVFPRHLAPLLIACVLLFSVYRGWNAKSLKVAAIISLFLIFNNVVNVQARKLNQFVSWQLGQALLAQGFKPSDIYDDWEWFAYYGMVPGSGQRPEWGDWISKPSLLITTENPPNSAQLGAVEWEYLGRHQSNIASKRK